MPTDRAALVEEMARAAFIEDSLREHRLTSDDKSPDEQIRVELAEQWDTGSCADIPAQFERDVRNALENSKARYCAAQSAALAVAEREFARRDVLEAFRSLPTDHAREELLGDIFEEFCRHCGTKQPLHGICQCWNDE